jgi:hypothetical protein
MAIALTLHRSQGLNAKRGNQMAPGSVFSARGEIMWLADRIPGYTVISAATNALRVEHETTATDFTLDTSTWLPVRTAGTRRLYARNTGCWQIVIEPVFTRPLEVSGSLAS